MRRIYDSDLRHPVSRNRVDAFSQEYHSIMRCYPAVRTTDFIPAFFLQLDDE